MINLAHKIYQIVSPQAKRVTRKTARKLIGEFARYYDVDVYFYTEKDIKSRGGFYRPFGAKPGIYINMDSEKWLDIFFHELGHNHCHKNGIWKSYHTRGRRSKCGLLFYPAAIARAAMRTGYRAECWIDRWAQKEMQRWFPGMSYQNGYEGKPDTKKWLYKNHLCMYERFVNKGKK
jgi:hypothetical protein